MWEYEREPPDFLDFYRSEAGHAVSFTARAGPVLNHIYAVVGVRLPRQMMWVDAAFVTFAAGVRCVVISRGGRAVSFEAD